MFARLDWRHYLMIRGNCGSIAAMQDIEKIWDRRLKSPAGNWLTARSRLLHFALIQYALPKERLEKHIPTDIFEIPEFDIDGRKLALISAVPFLDVDFCFERIMPFMKFRFGQTNHRAYVIHRETGEHCAWFFGTTLGSPVVHIPRQLWRIPWHQAGYKIDCAYDKPSQRFTSYRYKVTSDWCSAEVDIEDTGEPVIVAPGFPDAEELALILTHPVDGYFYRLDGRLGTYSVWHDRIKPLTHGRPKHLYFSLYERLGLLSREEMNKPHSIFLAPETEFRILLPPRLLKR